MNGKYSTRFQSFTLECLITLWTTKENICPLINDALLINRIILISEMLKYGENSVWESPNQSKTFLTI